ncbi:MAG: hydrogenase/urease maturation nickel metallochaperone HypA [Candidatus Omnitrophota bacterium]|nr:hydrogenase/urease maturation nickel metallochaperone HypA [Candidatus Omnitrophota bacterium]
MHETHLIDNILKYLKNEESKTRRKIKKIHVTLSEFGAITAQHFLEHFKEVTSGTKWSGLTIVIKKVKYGPEFEITKINFK